MDGMDSLDLPDVHQVHIVHTVHPACALRCGWAHRAEQSADSHNLTAPTTRRALKTSQTNP